MVASAVPVVCIIFLPGAMVNVVRVATAAVLMVAVIILWKVNERKKIG